MMADQRRKIYIVVHAVCVLLLLIPAIVLYVDLMAENQREIDTLRKQDTNGGLVLRNSEIDSPRWVNVRKETKSRSKIVNKGNMAANNAAEGGAVSQTSRLLGLMSVRFHRPSGIGDPQHTKKMEDLTVGNLNPVFQWQNKMTIGYLYPMFDWQNKSSFADRDLIGLNFLFKEFNETVDPPQKIPMIQLPWLNGAPSAVNFRVLREVETSKETPKIQLPWLKGAASAVNFRVRRASTQGKGSFDDSYFLGPDTSCTLPQGLQTVDIRCRTWPTYTRCISYCVYGSTFDEGIQREHSCKFKENKWSKDFDECKPFVNCKVQLKSPGNVKCFDNELSNKPYCDIYCKIYEDKDEVETQSYHCNANVTWTPPLPFCAEPRGHVTLAKAPKVIEHTSFKYPKAMKP